MRIYWYTILIALSLLACNFDDNHGDYAYFGGEIINPTTTFVVLSKAESVIDTIGLDKNNRFLYKINNLVPGMYTFRHGSELQTVFLEPKDSIIFRLNTFDFDEFKNKYSTSTLFNKIAQSNIKNSYYSSKEIYPFVNCSINKRSVLNSLPKDFYNYRKDIEYNNDSFNDYLNYSSFLRSNFNNLALEKHFDHSKETHFNDTSLCYNLDKLNIIDSLVVNPTLKNNLLYYFTISFLTKNKKIHNDDAILESFLSKSTDPQNNEIITNLVHSLNALKPGNNIPSIEVVNFKNTEIPLNSLISKPTAIYFWSNKFYDHFKECHHKVLELKTKYPEIGFISINIDEANFETWTNTLKRNMFSLENEYQFKNPEESMQILAIYPITKVLIIDKDNTIINSNTNLFSSNFEEQLLGLVSR